MIRASLCSESIRLQFYRSFYSRPKSKSSVAEPPSFSDVELRSRTSTSTPLNPKRQSLGALRSDRRLRQILWYLYPLSPANPFTTSFSLPHSSSTSRLASRDLLDDDCAALLSDRPAVEIPADEKHPRPLLLAVAHCVTELGYAMPRIQSQPPSRSYSRLDLIF